MINKKIKNIFLIVVLFALVVLVGCYQQSEFVSVEIENSTSSTAGSGLSVDSNKVSLDLPNDNGQRDSDLTQDDEENSSNNTTQAIKIPSKHELDVDFASQAPFNNWELPFKEACEEASMIMVAKYFSDGRLDESIMEREIISLVDWQEEHGYQMDSTAQEVVDILSEYFELNARLENEVTVDRIKYELSRGNLIIAPAAGRDLDNPNFQNPGPIYHMLVIKGYDNDEFITNDPGTRNGNGFRYKYNNLLSAVHDWDHSLAENGMVDEEIRSTSKVMVVISKK